jgi:hypothetical protein
MSNTIVISHTGYAARQRATIAELFAEIALS